MLLMNLVMVLTPSLLGCKSTIFPVDVLGQLLGFHPSSSQNCFRHKIKYHTFLIKKKRKLNTLLAHGDKFKFLEHG